MGGDKRPYDITMSRRTRRPPKVRDANENSPWDCPPRDVAHESEENDRKSLKELIDGDEKTKAVSGGDEGGKGRSSLGQHFTEGEKQLQIVGVQQKESLHGLKLKKMVSRYAKVLGYLMKKNRDPSLRDSKKKPIPKLIL
ncbi:hypothetical protein L484_002670 [Morus notabilis]|uniref:Uncharacterized protein n=1 Tax=Morus notabilis TaxID=981085 RepID=W9RIE8_9ROSA|nr:uncharacterized protein LOC21386231 [Morus notabilis]EXB75448.1 hypothetical protein L484_002670 [Morus notabilis]